MQGITIDFPDGNRASEILSKIGNGTADADFARAIGQCVDATRTTDKKSKLKLSVEIIPRKDMGCMELRVEISTSLPRLPNPSTQVHVASDGTLLTQMEHMLGGHGPSEKPMPVMQQAQAPKVVADAPKLAPVAEAPKPAPVAEVPKPEPIQA